MGGDGPTNEEEQLLRSIEKAIERLTSATVSSIASADATIRDLSANGGGVSEVSTVGREEAEEIRKLEDELARLTSVSLRQSARLEDLRSRRDQAMDVLLSNGGAPPTDVRDWKTPAGPIQPLNEGWSKRQDKARP